MKNEVEPLVHIELQRGIKRSWRLFREMTNREMTKQGLKHRIDLRKGTKTFIPFYLQLTCDKCGQNELAIRKASADVANTI